MLNDIGLQTPFPFSRSNFQRNVNLAHHKFQQAAELKNDPPLAQKSIAEGLQDLTEAVGEIGLKLNLNG